MLAALAALNEKPPPLRWWEYVTILSETYKEKSFRAYGLDLPRIKEVLPTNLPTISADEKRMDNLFLLEDDTLAIVDYESEDKGRTE